MEANPVFEAFYKELQSSFCTNVPDSDESVDMTVKHIEEQYYPHILKILQRDERVFESSISFRGIDLSQLWKEREDSHEVIWKNLLMCLFASFFHGDFKEKIGTVMKTVKGLWGVSGHENDEVTRILNDEKSEDYFKEILEYLQETRLAKIFMKMVEEIDISEFDLNFENPQDLVDILRNPEHPKMKKIIEKIQGMIKRKMEHGEFSQQQIISEIEGIKAKVQSLFGNVFNDMLGGRRADVPAGVLMGTSPEARRQRMLARLQKKQRDKNSR